MVKIGHLSPVCSRFVITVPHVVLGNPAHRTQWKRRRQFGDKITYSRGNISIKLSWQRFVTTSRSPSIQGCRSSIILQKDVVGLGALLNALFMPLSHILSQEQFPADSQASRIPISAFGTFSGKIKVFNLWKLEIYLVCELIGLGFEIFHQSVGSWLCIDTRQSPGHQPAPSHRLAVEDGHHLQDTKKSITLFLF